MHSHNSGISATILKGFPPAKPSGIAVSGNRDWIAPPLQHDAKAGFALALEMAPARGTAGPLVDTISLILADPAIETALVPDLQPEIPEGQAGQPAGPCFCAPDVDGQGVASGRDERKIRPDNAPEAAAAIQIGGFVLAPKPEADGPLPQRLQPAIAAVGERREVSEQIGLPRAASAPAAVPIPGLLAADDRQMPRGDGAMKRRGMAVQVLPAASPLPPTTSAGKSQVPGRVEQSGKVRVEITSFSGALRSSVPESAIKELSLPSLDFGARPGIPSAENRPPSGAGTTERPSQIPLDQIGGVATKAVRAEADQGAATGAHRPISTEISSQPGQPSGAVAAQSTDGKATVMPPPPPAFAPPPRVSDAHQVPTASAALADFSDRPTRSVPAPAPLPDQSVAGSFDAVLPQRPHPARQGVPMPRAGGDSKPGYSAYSPLGQQTGITDPAREVGAAPASERASRAPLAEASPVSAPIHHSASVATPGRIDPVRSGRNELVAGVMPVGASSEGMDGGMALAPGSLDPVTELRSGAPTHQSEGQSPARMIAVQIAEVARSQPDRPVELTLRPEELGKVTLTFSTESGALSVAVNAERADTLDLMRRHIETLAQELRALGYRDVSFAFGQNGRQFGGDAQTPGSDTGESASATTDRSAMPGETDAPTRTGRNRDRDGIDIRI